MIQGEKKTDVELLSGDLEPYRRLVDLQKQMIELVRQHEKTKSECAVLREQLLEEMTRKCRQRWSLRRTAQSGVRRLKNLMALWKFHLISRPQPNVTLLTRNRLLKI